MSRCVKIHATKATQLTGMHV